MTYRAIGVMSGSSLDGLDICFAEIDEIGGQWTFSIKAAACKAYTNEWQLLLQNATQLSAKQYLQLNVQYGQYIGEEINTFIADHQLQHQVQLIACHGHTSFHDPENKMTAQLGDGAAIAAKTGINVVSDLRAMDVALAGQGAPIVPIGERLLLPNFDLFLNLGGIANLSAKNNIAANQNEVWITPPQPMLPQSSFTAFDICPANRVLNMLANEVGLAYDDGGKLAASGKPMDDLLNELNQLDFYQKRFPKSLANHFGTDVVYPIIKKHDAPLQDLLHTYTEHVCVQIKLAVGMVMPQQAQPDNLQLLVSGGGAYNTYLISRLQQVLLPLNIKIVVPDALLIEYKEALIMALIGILRWREENNVLHTATGASRSSIGGAVWMGQEA